MATQPTDPIVRIAENDTTLPSTGLSNKLLPPTSILTVGYDANEIVPAEDLNYILDNFGKWLQYQKDVAESQVIAGDGLDSDVATIGEGQTISLGVPSTLNGSTSNEVTGVTHTHELTIASVSDSQAGVNDESLMTPSKVNDALDMVGMVFTSAFNSTPSGRWLKCNGAAVSRTAYSDLFDKIGTTWGVGDGSTTFNVPDLRGEFIRIWDDGRGVDSGRVFASFQDYELQSHDHDVTVRSTNDSTTNTSFNDVLKQYTGANNYTVTSSSVGGSETRPRNIALAAWIRY